MRANLIAGIDIATGVKRSPVRNDYPFRRTGRAGGVDNVAGCVGARTTGLAIGSLNGLPSKDGISSDPALASC